MWLVAILSSIVCGIAFYGLLGLMGLVPGMLIGFLIAGRIDDARRIRRMEEELRGLKDAISKRREETAAPVPRHAAPEAPSPETGPPPPEPAPLKPAPAVPAASRPQAAAVPSSGEPGYADSSGIATNLKRFLTGGNLAVTVGVLVLFFGVSFLVKYAAEHGLFPVELRLSLAGALGIILCALGWKLAGSRRVYGLVLQGGGVGIMYLTIFAALRLYGLIPAWAAFVLLVALCVLSAVLAVVQDSAELAFMAATGGFLAPVIASTGGGNHVFLFGYYAMINSGIVAVAWFKSWRRLNLAGFLFTFGIGMSWGFKYYTPEHFSSVEPFLILYFLMFASVSIAFATGRGARVSAPVDATLVFGLPVVVFFLQSLMVERFEYGLAISAFALGAFYILTAAALFRLRPAGTARITEAFLAFGMVFTTLAVPLAVDGRWTSAIWAMEGAGVYWAGVRQGRIGARNFGAFVQVASGFAFLTGAHLHSSGIPVFNTYYLGCLLISLAGLFTAYQARFRRGQLTGWERYVGHAMMYWGVLWWLTGGLHEVFRHLPYNTEKSGAVLFVSASFAAIAYAARRLGWEAMRVPASFAVPALWLIALAGLIDGRVLDDIGFIAWPAGILLLYTTLYLINDMRRGALKVLHSCSLWLIALLAASESARRLSLLANWNMTWPYAAWGAVPAAISYASVSLSGRGTWPMRVHKDAYSGMGAAGLFVWLTGWLLFVNLALRGDPWPLYYIPLLNPLDIACALALGSLIYWMKTRGARDAIPSPGLLYGIWGGSAIFLWLTASLLRALSHIADVPFGFHRMMSSVLVQASLSIFWSVLALACMISATLKGIRRLWITGASLLGVVVLKLFIIDLEGTDTVSRIVSFVAVGILLLLVGYFSPLPPRQKEDNAK